jgi:GntR family transcriptional regulator
LPVSLYYGSETPVTDTARPLYLKLRDMVATGIIDGTYPEGRMLPSVRAFAAQNRANPLTVSKAFQHFQLEGLVQVQRGVGMVVAPGAARRLQTLERERFLNDAWPKIRARMLLLGIDAASLAASD